MNKLTEEKLDIFGHTAIVDTANRLTCYSLFLSSLNDAVPAVMNETLTA